MLARLAKADSANGDRGREGNIQGISESAGIVGLKMVYFDWK